MTKLLSSLTKFVCTVIALSAISSTSFAHGKTSYTLDNELSSVSFVTIKKQYVVEPAIANELTGSIDQANQLNLSIALASIDTGIGIRNTRLNQLFFQSDIFPTIKVTAALTPQDLIVKNGVSKKKIAINVNINGHDKVFETQVLVTQVGKQLVVSSLSPVIISAADFAIPAKNIIALAKTVGGISISTIVPVNFNIVFNKNQH